MTESLGERLLCACFAGDLNEVKEVITLGCDPNTTWNANGWTPLHCASWNGYVDVLIFLCDEQHCDVNCTDVGGMTPLHHCCYGGHLNVAKYLTDEKRCDVNFTDKDGRIPLHYSCQGGHLHVVKYLTDYKGCDVNITDKDGWTPLHLSCGNGHLQVVKYLCGDKGCDVNMTNKYGSTPLHYSCGAAIFFSDVFEYLLKEVKCDPNQLDKDGMTLLSLAAGKPAAVQLLLAYGATPPYEEWNKYLQVDGPQQPAEAFAKTFLVGFPSGGKSSLAKSFRVESVGMVSRLINRLKKVSDVDLRTAGIITHDISSKHFGQMTIYDLAGHSEFYASHDVTLRNALFGSPSSIVLLVTDMRNGGVPFRKSIIHWCSFTENLFDSSSEHLPFLIVVGSHADLASSKDIRSCLAVVESLKGSRTFSSFRFKEMVTLDCRYAESRGMFQLRSVLSECCQVLKQEELISFREHCFLVSLLDRFGGMLAVTINDVISDVAEGHCLGSNHRDYLPRDPRSMCDICIQLNKRGNIQFFFNYSTPGDSWIVLNKQKILNLITGSIFAPADFHEHMGVATNTGILPASKISPHFQGLDLDLIVSFMCHHQYCHEVTDREILHQLLRDHSSLDQQFLFFPGLVTITSPIDVWESSIEFSHQFIWFLKCCNPDQFLSSRFLQVLVLRLAFCYAMAHSPSNQLEQSMIHRRCSVWKSGIFWCSLSGIDVIVEVVEQKKVVVYVRSRLQCELEGITLRSAVISKVINALNEFCPMVDVDEYFVGPDSIQYPLREPATLVSMSDLAMSITSSQRFVYDTRNHLVEVDRLLYFEPFAKLGQAILQTLFVENDVILSNEFINQVSKQVHSNTDKYVKLLDIVLNRTHHGDICEIIQGLKIRDAFKCSSVDLCSTLTKGSVFAGRNPFLL